MTACGLDFGTSNSALGIVRDGAPALAPVEGDDTLIPSAIFFDFETNGRVLFGREAIDTYIGQHEGRLMRALKSILGSPLIDESTAVGRRAHPADRSRRALRPASESSARRLSSAARSTRSCMAGPCASSTRRCGGRQGAIGAGRHRQARRLPRCDLRIRADRGGLSLRRQRGARRARAGRRYRRRHVGLFRDPHRAASGATAPTAATTSSPMPARASAARISTAC